jgi:hypothetical protein
LKLQPFLALLCLVIISDMIACAIGGYTVLKTNGNPTMRRLGWALLGLFTEMAFHLLALAFGYVHKPEYTVGFATSFWTGKAVRSLTLWIFVLHIIGYKKGSK